MRDVLAAFRAAIMGVTVYAAGEVPNEPSLPYVVVFGTTPRVGDYSHASTSASRRWRVATMYVGSSADSALWVAEKVEASLLDRRLSVPGKACSRLRREAGSGIKPDPDVESLSSGTDTWTFTITNA